MKSHFFCAFSKSSQGIGLLEILIAMVILGILGVGAAQTVQGIISSTKIAGGSGEVLSLKLQVLNVLSNSQACAIALQDLTGNIAKFNPISPTDPTGNTIAQIKVGAMVLAKAGQTIGAIQFTSMNLQELDATLRQAITVNSVAATRTMARLNISTKIRVGNGSAAVQKLISMPITIETDTSGGANNLKIVGCAMVGGTADNPEPGGVISTVEGPFPTEIVCNNVTVSGTVWSFVFRFHGIEHLAGGDIIRYRDLTGSRKIDFNADGSYESSVSAGSCVGQNVRNLTTTAN